MPHGDQNASLAILLGQANTYKGRLARAFLADTFVPRGDGAIDESKSGFAVLLTTQVLDKTALVDKLLAHLGIDQQKASYAQARAVVEKRTLCRRLAARHMASADLLEAIERHVLLAQSSLALQATRPTPARILEDPWYLPQDGFDFLDADCPRLSRAERRRFGPCVRFVLDDWSAIISAHALIARDAYLLQSLIAILKRERVNALIVSTQDVMARGSVPLGDIAEPNELQRLDELQLLTWAVPFFGERRVALAVQLPATEMSVPRIFELRPLVIGNTIDQETLMVDEHFQLYSDLEAGAPDQIPLFIRLYGGNHSHQSQASFLRYVSNSISQVFSSPKAAKDVVTFEPNERYDDLFAFADSQINTRLDHSVVVQIDEFWSEGRRSLLDLTSFLDGVSYRRPICAPGQPATATLPKWNAEEHADRRLDIFGNYQPHSFRYDPQGGATPEKYERPAEWVPEITSKQINQQQLHRRDFFWTGAVHDRGGRVDRIPYLWDFGFLVVDRRLWERNARVYLDAANKLQIGDIWQSLCCDISTLPRWIDDEGNTSDYSSNQAIGWEEFFAACRLIGEREAVAPFDVDLSTSESLSCLLIELWGSLQVRVMKEIRPEHWPELWQARDPADPLGVAKRDRNSAESLRRLCELYEASLFVSFIHLVTTCPHLRSADRQVHRSHLSPRAAASREWYHTASALSARDDVGDLALLRLPGVFTVRGDWSLGAAAGSRSEMLAHHALDILSSRRVNLLRLQDGIGLPVRDILPDGEIGDLVSAIRVFDTKSGQQRALRYREVCRYGQVCEETKLRWAFRSYIRGFDRDSFYWRRWIARMIEESAEYWPPEFRTTEHLRKVLEEQLCETSFGQFDVYQDQFERFLDRLRVLRGALRN